MRIITDISEMQKTAEGLRLQGKRIGVVPTMGYLHDGHLSLIRIAKEKADVAVTTIFVNPTQFGPTEDFRKYPHDIERDKRLAESVGTDILFTPLTEEMYSIKYQTFIEVEKLTKLLEGKSRPTHFRGVTTVVAKLFNITKPHVAVFGQKDAQQACIVQQMVRDLNFDIEIIVAPIKREPDGLAMSSRNVYLSSDERRQSAVLHKSLQLAQELIARGERDCGIIVSRMNNLILEQPSARVDYISIADATSLMDLSSIERGQHVLVSLAVRFGSTRLIDNCVVKI